MFAHIYVIVDKIMILSEDIQYQLMDLRLQHSIGRRAQHVCACGKTFKKQFQLANHQRCLLQILSILTAFQLQGSLRRPTLCLPHMW